MINLFKKFTVYFIIANLIFYPFITFANPPAPPAVPVCGDGICCGMETKESCPKDCGVALPIGSLDYADSIKAVGWAYDADAGTDPILVHIYINGVFYASEQASVYREDLVSHLGDGYHGYNHTFSPSLGDGVHKIEVYAINQPVGDNPKIGEITVNATSNQANNIEAESGTLVSPMVKAADSAASGGYYIVSGTSNSGEASYSVSVNESATYKIAARVYAGGPASDSFFVSFNNGDSFIWDLNPSEDPAFYNVWREDDVTNRGTGTYSSPQNDPYVFNLLKGTYKIAFKTREANTRMDYFRLEKVEINYCEDGTPPNTCSNNQPKYCGSSGQLTDNCSLCGCSSGSVCSSVGTYCEASPVCGDGVCNGDETHTSCPADCPPPPDTTAPIITNVAVSEITYNSAIISWNTDEPATSQVEYGFTSQYGGASDANTTPTQNHSIKLTGLSSDAIYNFRAVSVDAAGNTGYSANGAFTTEGAPDTTPPSNINDLKTSNITQSSVDLTWTAPGNDGNIGTASYYDIRYSTAQITELNWDNAYQLTGVPVPGPASTTEHYAAVGFPHSSTYYFAIKTGDQTGNISGLSNVVSATTQTPTLSVSLAATEESGYAPLNDVDLTASVSGTATGNINYIFYCHRTDDGTNVTTPYDAKFDNLSATTKTVDNLCSYDTPGTYSAKVIVQRSGLSAENRAIISVMEPLDTTAPVISNIAVSDITYNSVKIGWNTDEPAYGEVQYGLSSLAYDNSTGVSIDLLTVHSFSLSNLLPDTIYNYRVRSQDSAGNLAVSENRTFKTAPAPDTTPPAAVSDLSASDIGENSLRLTWTSPGDDGNVGTASSYDIRYSTTAITEANWSSAVQASSEPSPAIAGTAQEMTIAGLKADTTYYFALKTTDEINNTSALSNVASAKTMPSTQVDTIPPVISNISVDTSYSKAGIITWNTNEPADSKVLWGSRSNNLDQTAYKSELVESHQIVLVDLQRKTTYYYKVISKDAAGNESQSATLSFTTNARNNAVEPVLYLMASNGSVALSWKNPDYEFARKIVIARATNKYPSKNDKDSVIAEIKNLKKESYIDKNVTDGVTYYYSVFVVDDLGNYSVPATVSYQPLSAKEEKRQISGGGYSENASQGKVKNAEGYSFDGGLLLKWENPADGNYVRTIISRKEGEAPVAVNEGDIVYEGSGTEFTDKEVLKGKTYGYGIFTYDRKPNYSEAVKLTVSHQSEKKYVQISRKTTEHSSYGIIKSLSSVPAETVDKVSLSEAAAVSAHNSFVNLSKASAELYDRIMVQTKSKVSQKQKYSLAYFIQNGTQTTQSLGAGERAGVVSSFEKTYGKLPSTDKEWQDAIKIANGRWPGQKMTRAEEASKKDFSTIYKRESGNSANDNAAVTIMAYGLRPVERNINSEAAAINSFKSIYGKAPSTAADWDKVRAIAYSGAKR
jgi:hypothetical protein